MSQDIRTIVKKLSNIRTQLSSLNPDDAQTIVEIGAAFEELLPTIPENFSKGLDGLALCLESLQAIYEKSSTDPSQLIKATVTVIVAVEQYIGGLGNPICEALLNQSKPALENILADIRSVTSNTLAETPQKDISIDSIAMMLIEINPNDFSHLVALKKALVALLENSIFATNIQENLVRAKELAEQLTSEQSIDKQLALTKISDLIEIISRDLNVPSAPLQNAPSLSSTASNIASSQSATTPNDVLSSDLDFGLLQEFVIESNEYIEASEAALLSLETDPDNLEAVNVVFRAFHTIKGTSAFLGLKRLSSLTHQAESLFSRIRDREINCVGKYADLALRSSDMVKAMLVSIEKAIHGEPLITPDGYDQLSDALIQTINEPIQQNEPIQSIQQMTSNVSPTQTKPIEIKPIETDSIAKTKSNVVAENISSQLEQLNHQIHSQQENAPVTTTNITDQIKTATKSVNNDKIAEASVRVRTDRLDKLIDTIGELVIAQSMIAQDGTVSNNLYYELSRKVVHMGKIVRELQDLSMTMRMVPLKASFQKMNRLVRDLSRQCGKSIELITEGEDTEIDRNMVDIINDPLVHMIRNAIDHGIEDPETREAKGKSRTGKISLSAYNAGGNIVIELSDDGQGLNRNRILDKAISKGLLEVGKNLSDHEVFNLIFAPGFSTAEKVTDLSGRGVGMDVVKRSIEALSGNIEISSEPNQGSCFSIRLPLTLAITDAMLVKVGQERYIIPTSSIYLSFRPNANLLSSVTGRGEMVLLQGELMPIFRLHKLFSTVGAEEDPTQALLVIVADGKRRCALLVDELLCQQQVVAKSLGGWVGKVPGISGGAILGDGRVGLILDCAELILLARQLAASKNPACSELINASFLTEGDKIMSQSVTNAIDKKPPISQLGGKYLTFFLEEEEYGIEILKVQEIIGLMAITRVPHTPHFMCGVINLRGKVIAIVDLRTKFDMPTQIATTQTCIIVVRSGGLEIGIIVDKVSEVLAVNCEDIEETPVFGTGVNTDYLLGIAKVQGKVKLLLDIDKVLSTKELTALQAITRTNEVLSNNPYKALSA